MATDEEYRELDLQLGAALAEIAALKAALIATQERSSTCEVVNAVREKLRNRADVGLQKYGVSMMRTDLDLQAWMRLAQEEVMDMAVYLERIQIMLKEGK